MSEIDKSVPKIARNEMFYFIARACMIATIPLISFFGARIITQADALQSTVQQQTIDIRVFSATVQEKLNVGIGQLTDHELRLRQLERKN